MISPLVCPSSANKSCSKEWYKVVSWGDIYYNLGCSSQDPKAETEEKRVSLLNESITSENA